MSKDLKKMKTLILTAAFFLLLPAGKAKALSGVTGAPGGGPYGGGPNAVMSLTLPAAIQEAELHNPLYRKAQENAESKSWKKLEALSAYIPHISMGAQKIMAVEFQVLTVSLGGPPVAFPFPVPYTLLNLDATWTVFDGLGGWNDYKAAILAADAAELQYSRAHFQLTHEVQLRFYRALAAQYLAVVADQNIKTLEEHLTQAKARLRSGFGTRFDVLRIQVQLEDGRTQKINADDQVQNYRQELAQAMGLTDDNRPLKGDLPVPRAIQIPENLGEDLSHREDLEAQAKLTEAAEKKHAVAVSHWIPRVDLFGEDQFYNYVDWSLTANNPQAYTVGLRLTWNIFDGGATLARIKQASYDSLQAQEDLKFQQIQAPQDFARWRRRYLYAVAAHQASIRAADEAEESVRLAHGGLRAGVRTSTEVLDAELDLFRARAAVIRAEVDAAEALSNLELSLGRDL